MIHREDWDRKRHFRITPSPTRPINTETASLRHCVILDSNPRHTSNKTRCSRERNIAICSKNLQCGDVRETVNPSA